ncbi:unnamed protein product [Prunus armeniaca]|uniref:Uncharacterized protein n=1 Tax=Prunus armeniaca TaxID=36596 RepID=A0A6J5X6G6_PRUAR|nr:unnamed protein product [Prunus armeniaca]
MAKKSLQTWSTVVCLTFHACISMASHVIYASQSLSGNQTITSPSGIFELGFFTPGGKLGHNRLMKEKLSLTPWEKPTKSSTWPLSYLGNILYVMEIFISPFISPFLSPSNLDLMKGSGDMSLYLDVLSSISNGIYKYIIVLCSLYLQDQGLGTGSRILESCSCRLSVPKEPSGGTHTMTLAGATVHGAIFVYPKRGAGYPFPKPREEVQIILASLKILQEDKALGDIVVDGMVGDNTNEMAADINKDDANKSDTDVKMESAGKVTDAGRENDVGWMNAAERMNIAAGRVIALVRKTVDV